MKLFKSLAVLLVCLLATGTLLSQRIVMGTITDADSGESLIGATVIVPGTDAGTVADFDGKFKLEIPTDASALQISYTGYTSQEVVLGASNVIDIQLSAGALLDEVVVIGYGSVKKEDATGAISTVSSESFNKGQIVTPQSLVAGKIAGVQITSNGGAPGEASTIRIRGGSSLSASNDPLIVVDGVPVDNGSVSGGRNFLNFINPNDIETFTVLKDASATAIYGSRASNGVILITTKKGKLGQKIRVNYSGNVSVGSIIEKFDALSSDEFRTLIGEQFEDGHPAHDLLGTENTDWQEQIFQQAIGTDHNLSLSGGIAEVLPYRLSLGYTDQQGLLKTDNYNRSTASLNLTPGFFDNTLQVNVSMKGMLEKNQFADRGAIGSAVSFDPTASVFEDNDFGGYFYYKDAGGNRNTLSPSNPLALLEQTNDGADVNRFITNATVDYRFPFLPDLRANLNLGYDKMHGEGHKFIDSTAAFSYDPANGGGVDNVYSEDKINSLLEFYLNYGKEVGVHKFDILGGYSWQRFFYEKQSMDSNIRGTETKENNDTGELFLLSLFGRVNYTLMDDFLFTATLRRDGSSRFSPESRWGLFPAAAFAWKAINNPKGDISNLKVRLGYGVTGQQDIGGFYEHLARYEQSIGGAGYQFGDEFVTTLRPNGYDANIKWEETTTYNIGVDYGILGDRITGSFEYYIRNTKDLLNFIPIAAGTNLTNFLNTNVGDLENRGIEFSMNADVIKKKDLLWSLGGNVTANKNKITKLTASDDPDYVGVLVGGISGGVGNTVQIHQVGSPANSFYVGEQVYDANGLPIEGLGVDRNGDGALTNAGDLRVYKNPAPDYFFGFNTSLDYKKFNLSAGARANVGNYVYNNNEVDKTNYNRLFHPSLYLQNVLSTHDLVQADNPQYLSDFFVQNGSFFRFDYIAASYRLDGLFGKKGSNGLTISATVQNPLLVTNYRGIDPEIDSGRDNNIYPRSRTFVFGLNANF